ncbi:PREDICTED: uncharacterized protein C10orf71 homolog [Thamnophis sirtalis]|uniref:Uncharacterized protein C10orf71 homolog n=1 Tax=Thamnophis sirtalis TaxID=35019 RepID=A0A6I9XE05_9SAUR|nr:PREDICTED: uncharacterized protein C10orf71 homolog [Thamnophis sirtalis]
MQGNKKHAADGQSDASSIGSLLDDTDREVCSLTDRAFKSLCVAELQAPYTDVDPVVGPPNISHQFSSKFFHGPWDYALRRNTNFHKQLSKKEHATFLLSKVSTNSKTHEDKKYYLVNPSIRRKLDLPPLSDLHNCTHISKVSSLIKTFDKVDNQVSLLLTRQPVNHSLTEGPLICGDDMALWSGRRVVNIPKGIPELPDPDPNQGNPSDKRKGFSEIDLVYQSLPASHPSQANVSNTPKFSISNKTVKTRSEKAKEAARKSSFLHSENSAFESWKAHHKKIFGMGEAMPAEGSLGCFEEAPFFTRPRVSEPKPIGAFMLEGNFSGDSSPQSLSKASLSSVPPADGYFPSPADATCTVAPQLLAQGLAPVYEGPSPTSPTSTTLFPPRMSLSIPVSKAPLPPSPFPQLSPPPEAAFHPTDTQGMLMPHVTGLAEKPTKPEFALRVGNGGPPPWRKQKATLGRMKAAEVRAAEALDLKDSPYGKPPEVAPLVGRAAPESQVTLPDPPFGISALLTPVPPLEPQNEGPPGNRLLVVTPFMLEAGAAKEPEEKAFYSQNDYKSKAPRLLFNLKDIRKRVKSTYSPSPLLRALEDKGKREGHLKAAAMATDVLGDDSEKALGGTDKVNIFDQMDYIQEKDNFTSLNENFISDDVLLSLSKSRAGVLKYQNKNHLQQSDSVHTEEAERVSVHEQSEAQPAPSPKPHLAGVAAAQPEVVQEHKDKNVTLGQDADGASGNLLYPAEGKAGNQGPQACSSAGNDPQGRRSPHDSSEQSFVTTADQPLPETASSLMQLFQKACLQESQRRRNDADEREEKSDREGEEKAKEEDFVLKPTLFMIKDNTFKSPPVTKAIKLPLLRSLSCEEAPPAPQENPRDAQEDGDAFGYASSPLSNSAGSSLQSPRSASVGPLSDTTANISQSEKAADHPPHRATGSPDQPSATPTLDPERRGQLPGDADGPLGTDERLQLVSQMGRTTAKPPTVPPKTEKALRRAKKLASRRKKMEAQQKKLQDETLAQNEDASSLTPVQSMRSLVCPDSPLTAPKCDPIKHQPLLPVSPTPSLPATQRKLLQDPDSGEFFIVDLPLRLKTFYDPESGSYIQVPVPSCRRNVSQTPSPETSFPPSAWGPSTLPPRVASVPALPSSAQLSEMFTKASGSVSDEQPGGASSPGPLDGSPCPDPPLLDIRGQNVDGSPSNFEKDMSPSAATENVSMGSAEEFVAEEGVL